MTIKELSAIVAGTGFEGRAEIIRAHCKTGSIIDLRREPDNSHDPEAIAVWLQCRVFFGLFKPWAKIGYIKAARADGWAPKMDAGNMRFLGARVQSMYAPAGREYPRVSLMARFEAA